MGVQQDSSPMTSDGAVYGASPRGILKNGGSGEELMSKTDRKARESPLDGPLTDLWENLIETKITEEKYVKKKQQDAVSSRTSWITERAAAVGRASPMMWLSTKLSTARWSSSSSAQKELFPDRSPSKAAQSRVSSNADGGARSPAKAAAAAGQGGEEESVEKKMREAAARRGLSCSLVGERRFKLNNVERVGTLKKIWATVDPDTPMQVVQFYDFKTADGMPRSCDGVAQDIEDVPDDAILCMVTHKWLRPWHDKADCEKHSHRWAGKPHPDNDSGTKHKLVCKAAERLCREKGWDMRKLYLWVDYCCIEQDNSRLRTKGVKSMLGYIAACDCLLIPSMELPPEGATSTNRVSGGNRGWFQLETMCLSAISGVLGNDAPEIWVAAVDKESGAKGPGGGRIEGRPETKSGLFLSRFAHVMDKMPSEGLLFSKGDREAIRGHEKTLVRLMEQTVARRGWATKHKGWVMCVSFHPIEKGVFASAGEDGEIRIVNAGSGALRAELVPQKWEPTPRGSEGIRSVAWSWDGKWLATGGKDKSVRVFSMEGMPVEAHYLKGHTESVDCVSFSPSGAYLASASRDKTVRLWLLSNDDAPKLLHSLEGNSKMTPCVAWSPDSARLVSSGDPDTILVWEVPPPAGGGQLEEAEVRQVMSLTGHGKTVTCLTFSPGGGSLASGSRDKTVKVWDLTSDTPAAVKTLPERKGDVTCLAWSPNGCMLASGGYDCSVEVWDVADASRGCARLDVVSGHTDAVRDVSFSADSGLLASASNDKAVRLWRSEGKEPKRRAASSEGLKQQQQQQQQDFSLSDSEWKGVRCILWSPSGTSVVFAGGDITVWDLAMDPVHARKWTMPGHDKQVASVAFSPDGQILASGGSDSCVKVWDMTPGGHEHLKASLRAHTGGEVMSLAWSPDGNTIASGGGDSSVRVWGRFVWHRRPDDKDLHAPPVTLTGHESQVTGLAWAGNGVLLASCGKDNIVKVWNFSSSTDMRKAISQPTLAASLSSPIEFQQVAWSPSSTFLAAAGTTDVLANPPTMMGRRRSSTLGSGFLLRGGAQISPPQIRRMSLTRRESTSSTVSSTVSSPTARGKRVAVWRPSGPGQFEEVYEETEEDVPQLGQEKRELFVSAAKALSSAKATASVKERWAGDGKHTVMRAGNEVQVHDHNRRLVSSFQTGSKVAFVCCQGGNIVAGCEGGGVYLLKSTILEQAAARGHAKH